MSDNPQINPQMKISTNNDITIWTKLGLILIVVLISFVGIIGYSVVLILGLTAFYIKILKVIYKSLQELLKTK